MKRLMEFFEHLKYKTLLKYFFSYFFIISALLFCFFVAFRQQLQNLYDSAWDKSIQEKLEIFKEDINDGLDTVFQVHYNLENNRNLSMFRHSGSMWDKYLALADMREFTSSNPYIADTVYIDHKNGTILVCNSYITLNNNAYLLKKENTSLVLPVQQYGHQSFNRVVYVENKGEGELLLFPSVSNQNYDLFYILDRDEIFTRLEGLLPDGVLSACLLDSDKQLIKGTAGEEMLSCLNNLQLSSGIEKFEDDGNVLYMLPFYPNLYMVASYSKNTLLEYANEAFFNSYLIIAVIGSIGVLLLLLAMKWTYVPLHRLTKKYIAEDATNESFVKQLDQMLNNTLEQKQELQKKIEKYHDMMQESILDALAGEKNTVVSPEDMERLFNMEQGSMIFVATVEKKEGEDFQRYVLSALLGNSSCIPLEKNEKWESYLIYYSGKDQDKEGVLRFLMKEFYEDSGRKAALSSGSFSPLDIPSLYENSIMASEYWSEHPVSIYEEVAANKKSMESYPYQKLEDFSQVLSNRDFPGAKKQLAGLLDFLEESVFPPFYTRSVLIDIITVTVMTMNRLNIKFKAYGDVYFEALYYSRSFSYEEKSSEIRGGIFRLLDIFEEEMSSAAIYPHELLDIIEKEYTHPEFSITLLADRFHVSIAYISYLFKKYYDRTFSDYLWNLRVEKAKELLKDTEDSIENICTAVGYENASSFRRKFKKELGLTPSQYRESQRGGKA